MNTRLRTSAIYLISLGLVFLFGACTAKTSMETTGDLLPSILDENPTPVQPALEEIPLVDAAPSEPEVDECLTCHLDKQRLIDTAEPEAVVETENEGEG